MYKTITIKAGSGGWGGPLTITPTEKCNKVLSVTGEEFILWHRRLRI